MNRELDAVQVALRLATLRELYVPESITAARARLARERPPSTESFAETATRSLRELRALCELARHLHTR